jgi:hypothetical protein
LTKRGEAAAHPGFGILKSEFGAARYIGTKKYLFRGRQIKDQVSHYECLRWNMKKRDIFVFETREIAAMQ